MQHPERTLLGRISRGFDFLGYRFSSAGFAVSRQTIERLVVRVSQRDEQGVAGEGGGGVRVGSFERA